MNFWLLVVVQVVVALVLVLTSSLVVIYVELKAGSHMQGRIGPYYAGGKYGWAAPLADAAKFLQKEDLAPAKADRTVFGLAPYVVMMST
ncbi:MAG: NADH-quinone oxidoreductase subunit H, partial [Actinomycetia bacterium]|nr:NADH-quinone oxidoreductase subunit H [Actinomycetes bacterium]